MAFLIARWIPFTGGAPEAPTRRRIVRHVDADGTTWFFGVAAREQCRAPRPAWTGVPSPAIEHYDAATGRCRSLLLLLL